MHAYSQDLRDRVLGALERGERPSAIAKRFEVSRVWVYQVKARFHEKGERSSRPVDGYRVSRIAHLEATVRAWIKAQPDMTLARCASDWPSIKESRSSCRRCGISSTSGS